MKKLVIITIAMCFGLFAQAQTEEKIAFNRGVTAYQNGEYAKATESFKKAYDLNSDYLKALFNAGNAAYLNGDFEDSKQLFADYARFSESRIDKAKAHYSIGNVALQNGKSIEKELMQVAKDEAVSHEDKMKLFDTSQEEYKAAIKAYKESLRNNSNDEDVKYNLTYALKHLKHLEQQQQQEQQKGDSDKDKKDQEKQEGDQDKEDKDDKSDDKKDGDQGDEGDPKDGDKTDGDQKGDEKEDEAGKDGDPSDEEGDKEKDQKEDGDKDGKEEEKDKDADPKKGKNGDEKGKDEEKEIEGQISKAQAGKELDAMNNDEQKVLMKVFRAKEDKKKQTNSKKDW